MQANRAFRLAALGDVIDQTEGASPAFIREFLRRAALLAIEAGDGDVVLDDSHLLGALDELSADQGTLTSKLLGMQGSNQAD